MHKIAVIDLGTNTFNLLIASKLDQSFNVIHAEKIGVALGMGGINNGYISEDAFLRGINALIKFKLKCDELKTSRIIAIGTSALRDAKNKMDFINECFQKTGIEIHIVSGEREAELIYKGVKWTYAFEKPSLIMDIGGGSTEFILADSNGILEKQSFNIGVSRIFQELRFSDPFSSHDVEKIKSWLLLKTGDFFSRISTNILVGASGSFETFYEMIHKEVFKENHLALEFPLNELKESILWIINSRQEERDAHPYIIPIRRKMAPIAAVKTQWVMESLNINQTFVTPCALKEGVLYENFMEGL